MLSNFETKVFKNIEDIKLYKTDIQKYNISQDELEELYFKSKDDYCEKIKEKNVLDSTFKFDYDSYDFEEDELEEEEEEYTFDKYSNKYYKCYPTIDNKLSNCRISLMCGYNNQSDYSKLYYYYLKYKVGQTLEIEESNMYTTINIDWNNGCEICCNNAPKCKSVHCHAHMYSHFFVPGTPSFLIHQELNTVYESRDCGEIWYYAKSGEELYTKYIKLNNTTGLIKLGDLYNIYRINELYNVKKEIKSVYIEKNEYSVEEIEKLFN
jgi:hypothetical protein